MEYKILSNGVKMPILGLGMARTRSFEEAERMVLDAIDCGYRLIDTAAIYNNEEAIGSALEKTKIKREELFITSKLWITNNSYEKAKFGFYESLNKLGLDYIDLYMIHRPFGDYYGAYKALVELYQEGKIKAIGVSNFFMDRLIDLNFHQEIKPMVNQIQCHPFMQREFELRIQNQENIVLEAYSPFAVGANEIFKNPILKNIAEKHHKTVAQIILRWQIQRGIIVIPKSSRKNRLQENIDIFNFVLDSEDMDLIQSLDKTDKTTNEDDVRMNSVKRWLNI